MSEAEARRQQLALLVRAIDTKARTLVDHIHPGWTERAQRNLPVPVRGSRGSAVLSAAYELRWPSLDELRRPLHRVFLLERVQILQVLAAHGLHACRDRVRMSIGRETREMLDALVGETAHRLLVHSAAQGMADPQPLEHEELDLDLIAAAGFRRLCRTGAWASRDAMLLTRLALAPAAVEQAADFDDTAQAPLPDDVLPLHEYFPELSWLFGSDMDRSLSA